MNADPLPEIDLTLEQAAILFQCAVSVVSRMETDEFDARPVSAAIPRLIHTCFDVEQGADYLTWLRGRK